MRKHSNTGKSRQVCLARSDVNFTNESGQGAGTCQQADSITCKQYLQTKEYLAGGSAGTTMQSPAGTYLIIPCT